MAKRAFRSLAAAALLLALLATILIIEALRMKNELAHADEVVPRVRCACGPNGTPVWWRGHH